MKQPYLGWIAWMACIVSGEALEFARPFGDHMILPQGVPCPVWGRGTPGSVVSIEFGSMTKSARCTADGNWRLVLPPMPASADSRELKATSGEDGAVITDILVGEVWFASGQSNMDFPLARAVGGKAEAATAGEYPHIRLINLTGAPTDNRVYSPAELSRLTAERHFAGQWQVASPASAGAISAIAWWTGKAIHLKRKIPVGIIENAVGGSGAEAWLPREALEARSEYRPLLDAGWLESDKVGGWARGRAKRNLGPNTTAMHPFRPGFLFESGMRWWSGFPVSGVLWYQGESNADIPDDAWNERMIVDLVGGWRKALGQRDLPFYMIQLPRIGGNDPLRARWPEFREAQARAAKRMQGVRLIVTQDLGWDSPDVHPPDKLPVAERLASEILRGK